MTTGNIYYNHDNCSSSSRKIEITRKHEFWRYPIEPSDQVSVQFRNHSLSWITVHKDLGILWRKESCLHKIIHGYTGLLKFYVICLLYFTTILESTKYLNLLCQFEKHQREAECRSPDAVIHTYLYKHPLSCSNIAIFF